MGNKMIRSLMVVMLASTFSTATLAASQMEESYAKGSELVAKQQYKEAIPFFDKAIQADPKHSDAYLDRALCNFHLGNYQKVIEDCKEVIGHADAHNIVKRQAYTMCAGAQNATGDYNGAIASCDKALALFPRTSLCYTDRAYAYQQLKRYDEALRDCNEAIKLDSKHASNYEMRAAIHEELARQDRDKHKQLLQNRARGEKPWESILKTTESGKH